MAELRLDRHVLASGTSAWDAAWRTYGWTPALEGARAGRLEEEVPWGTRSARRQDPPRLTGSVEEVLAVENLDRLGRAFLPMDGRVGFSLWGAVGGEKIGSEWRIATHTLLMDLADFRALAGYPVGLLDASDPPPRWLTRFVESADLAEPAPLAAVEIQAGAALRGALVAARYREIDRLRERVLASRGGDLERTVRELTDLYEALAAALEGGDVRHAAIRLTGSGDGVALLRLGWLSLPLEDRASVFYVTEQRRTERPPGHLLGLPDDEWGRFVPEDAWVAGASEPIGPPSAGRRHWADRLVRSPAEFRRLDRRATLREWRVLGRDDLVATAHHAEWSERWKREGGSLTAVSELARRERTRSGRVRSRALGHALGRAVADRLGKGEKPLGVTADAVALLADQPEEIRAPALDGAVRALRGKGRLEGAGRLRCLATETLARTRGPLVDALHRFVDQESDALRTLLGRSGGAASLIRGAFPGAVAGDDVAGELVRLGVEEGTWDGPTGAELGRALRVEGSQAEAAAADLLPALVRAGREPREVESVADTLLGRLELPAVSRLADSLLRLAEGAVDPGTVEGLRRRGLMRLTAGTGDEIESAAAKLIALGARTVPPAEDPSSWEELVEEAPLRWLARPRILTALAEAFRAGERPFADPSVPDALRGLAVRIAGRAFERVEGSTLEDPAAEALLRLLWLDTGGEALTGLVEGRPGPAKAILAGLLTHPAPVPLFGRVRRALLEASPEGDPHGDLAPFGEGLRAYAPAVLEALGLDDAKGRFVPLASGYSAGGGA